MPRALTYEELKKRIDRLLEQGEKNKRVHKKLEITEKRYRELYEGSQDGYVRVDLSGNILEFNSAFKDMLGYSTEELKNKTFFSLTPRKWHASDKKIMQEQVIKKGYSVLFEKEYVKKDGTAIPVELRSYLIKDENGEPREMWGFIRDITERKRAEEELGTKNRNLQEVNTTLKVVLRRGESYKYEVEEKVMFNVNQLITPFLEQLKKSRLDEKQLAYVEFVDASIKEIISPFSKKLSSKYYNLTPTEIQVANLVKNGKCTKEIAEILNISMRTASFHRENIRRKIGIKKTNRNLRSQLLHIE